MLTKKQLQEAKKIITQKAGLARWKGKTVTEKLEHSERMNKAKRKKKLSTTRS